MIGGTVATGWGRLVGRYGRSVAARRRIRILAESALPDPPTIWVCWHEFNLVAIAVYPLVRSRAGFAIVPRGIVGATVTGWLEGSEIAPVPVDGDARGGLVLRRLREALAGGWDVVIAVDGPGGPRRELRPGAVWLAKAAAAPVIAFGCAAAPAVRFPRWDRHLIPLPGARIAVAMSAPLTFGREADAEANRRLADALDEQAARATAGLSLPAPALSGQAVPRPGTDR
ncbi:MAG TPA: hypothetical protein VFK86_17595 [Bauldia sp.]|nr:hypothetical protein [Bauldia sp.]